MIVNRHVLAPRRIARGRGANERPWVAVAVETLGERFACVESTTIADRACEQCAAGHVSRSSHDAGSALPRRLAAG
jgi:hypothetical protein